MGLTTSFGGSVALATKALEGGADRRSISHFEWDIAGGCTAPVVREIFARPDFQRDPQLASVEPAWAKALENLGLVPKIPLRGEFRYEPGNDHPLWVSLTVRCRRCSWCLRQRAKEWATKAQAEIAAAPRTWFATYTGNPDEQFRWLSIARVICKDGSTRFEDLSPEDRFRMLCRAANPDITRYVKRIRKQSGARIRYLFVAERHETGLPHWHALVHDCDPAKPIRKAVLKGQWPHGFSKFKLVENQGAAWYLCKYLSKELATRVRGSLRYGAEAHATLVHSNGVPLRESMTTKEKSIF